MWRINVVRMLWMSELVGASVRKCKMVRTSIHSFLQYLLIHVLSFFGHHSLRQVETYYRVVQQDCSLWPILGLLQEFRPFVWKSIIRQVAACFLSLIRTSPTVQLCCCVCFWCPHCSLVSRHTSKIK